MRCLHGRDDGDCWECAHDEPRDEMPEIIEQPTLVAREREAAIDRIVGPDASRRARKAIAAALPDDPFEGLTA